MWPETLDGPLDRLARVVETARAARFSDEAVLENMHWQDNLETRFGWADPALYVIEDLSGNPTETQEIFVQKRQSLSPQNRHKLKLLEPVARPGPVLFVGAAMKNLRGELRQHVLSITAATPSLKLSWWFTPRPYRIHLRKFDGLSADALALVLRATQEQLPPAFR
ncbi:hypothetical protein ERN12_00145 [Rhodobacteraceae bacterium]|nr:hypothetical protein ERN12_00145 [Paracoccaceae bacterium]